jgi:PHD/YefM family antitoxin component YafN of YafNO toxin-antitoxin module
VAVPEVLTFREFRAQLADTLRRVESPNADQFYVGCRGRAQAVVLSAARYARLAALERQEAMAEALASVRAEGLEPSPEGLEVLAAVADGRLSGDEARAALLARYRC